MKRKLLSMVLCGALATALLAGCGGNSGEEKGSSKENTESGGSNIVMFDARAYGTDEYDALLDEYAEANGLTIEIQHSPNDYDTLIMSRVNSNDIPDIFALQSGSAAQQYYEYAYDWSDDADILALFNEDAIATGLDEEGNVKSLPSTYETMGLIYNVDCFEQAGIETLPATLSELEEACEKLEAAGITPFAIAGKEAWVLHQIATNFMMDKSMTAAELVEKVDSGELAFADMPNYENLFKFLDLVVKYGSDKQMEYDWETSENQLANGEAAIISMGDWCQAVMDEFNPDANLAFLPCPVSENAEDATLASSVSWTYIVNKDSENLEAAKELLVHTLTSDEYLDHTCDILGNVPAAKGDFEVNADLANDAGKYISAGETYGWVHPLAPVGFQDNAGAAFQNYMLGNATAEETIQQIQDLWMN